MLFFIPSITPLLHLCLCPTRPLLASFLLLLSFFVSFTPRLILCSPSPAPHLLTSAALVFLPHRPISRRNVRVVRPGCARTVQFNSLILRPPPRVTCLREPLMLVVIKTAARGPRTGANNCPRTLFAHHRVRGARPPRRWSRLTAIKISVREEKRVNET